MLHFGGSGNNLFQGVCQRRGVAQQLGQSFVCFLLQSFWHGMPTAMPTAANVSVTMRVCFLLLVTKGTSFWLITNLAG